MDQAKHLSRKFIATMTIHLVSDIALFTGFIASGEWVAINTLILTVYVGGNVWEKKQ